MKRNSRLLVITLAIGYPMPDGKTVKFLDDRKNHLGNQPEWAFGGERCFGALADMDFLLICTYEKDGENPELVLYKKDNRNVTAF